MSTDTKKDFFVSYNRHDKAWAEWIAWILEESGYTVVIHAWDFRLGGNFVLDMHDAIDNTRRTIAVLSPNYLKSEFAQPEWAAAFVQDPKGKNRTLIPVRVEACELTGLLRALVYMDLVGVAKAEAQELLLRAVSDERTKPSRSSEFPQLGIPANLPLANQLFVGREQALEELHLQVRSGELTAISSIKGMGGIGKTELALQYALKHLKAQDYPGGVCWLKAREDIGLQIVQFAREKLGMIPPDDRELMAQVEWCWTNWQKAATLIVFDDVQAYADIQPFLPKHRDQFRVLLTTRKYLDGSVRNYEIQMLSEPASLELLRRLVSDGRIEKDLETTKQVCEWLGYLPLGLELVGRYLARKKGCSVAKLWERLQDDRLEAISLQKVEAGMTATLNVIKAFELSWQELNADAQKLAALLSLFALAEIPWSLVQQCLPEADEEELEDLRDEQLVNLSLLSFEGGENYQLHQLLREFFTWKRSQMPEDEEMKRSFCGVMVANAHQFPHRLTLEIIEPVSFVIPHLKEAAATLNLWLTDENLITPSVNIGWFYAEQLAFGKAEEWYKQCREIAIQRLGQDHTDVATSLNYLAILYQSLGRYIDAEPLLLQALEIRQRQFGSDHLDVAQSLNNLATLYQSQERYIDAEPLLLQALEISQRQLGADHPNVAWSQSNLGELYRSLGRYIDAEPLLLQALEIRQRQFGSDHPEVATSLNNLALLYWSQERYVDAEALYIQALQISRKPLGEDHPDMALWLSNLAGLYATMERYVEAEILYLQAFSIFYERLGEMHHCTQDTLEEFVYFLQEIAQSDRTSELSDHPLTRSLLQQLQNEES
ncbi:MULTISPECIES: tetratricopeptide repeat protein [Leptolyngbya]|uniref:tetratricopeptide repeat protein n=1 Tax=Leptolyngbya TaxID=47251 RepID=UPI0016824ECC|nr:toll/interleukin-1 receptor domain-containing protein [Leptolyngbya sp. FACHB-1624]MBD1854027.1 tetratricopeptide repeat protein [Leptolyngbya sp. FACHB-1624]